MAFKTLFFASLLLAAIAFPMADAQSPGGLIGTLLGLIRNQGIVPCSLNEAGVQLRCGRNVVANATKNGVGAFSMVLNPLQFVLSSVLSNCSLAVTTPLSTYNAQLPSVGGLLFSLQLAGDNLIGHLNVADFIPAGFKFLPSI